MPPKVLESYGLILWLDMSRLTKKNMRYGWMFSEKPKMSDDGRLCKLCRHSKEYIDKYMKQRKKI